jgi:hypothetical protein
MCDPGARLDKGNHMTFTELLSSEQTTFHEYAEPAAGYAGWYEHPQAGTFAFKDVDGDITPFLKID